MKNPNTKYSGMRIQSEGPILQSPYMKGQSSPGEFRNENDKILKDYTQGFCHYLAFALAKLYDEYNAMLIPYKNESGGPHFVSAFEFNGNLNQTYFIDIYGLWKFSTLQTEFKNNCKLNKMDIILEKQFINQDLANEWEYLSVLPADIDQAIQIIHDAQPFFQPSNIRKQIKEISK